MSAPETPASAASALPVLEAVSGGSRLFALGDLSGLACTVEVPLGSVQVDVRRLVHLREGSILRLERTTGEPLDVTVNGTPIARGEVRVQGERFAVRITEILEAPRHEDSPGQEVPRAKDPGP